ncbi:MAG TPA: saccharopine dehydrogenase NADP-binding domain-containing protein [Thermoanaerobaculia bacterium]|nr:saccharopine dehydrogenase NADP-binding domain-containing protein [Thermoanaerobaculia bacterium]
MAWMIYGANGYTGELAAREAVGQGHSPILAGRNGGAVGRLASELGLPSRVFSLDDPQATAVSLYGIKAVLHCAGPFVHTSAPMVAACLATGAHYLDITGEIAVFESILGRGEEAKKVGVALLPGTGFDVVPSDCLAARLASALPDATDLALAFDSAGGSMSRGTLKTMLESLPAAGAIRRNGEIVPVPVAFDVREIDFGPGTGKRWAMTIPWGDVSTAYHSTGIPNVRVYSGMPPGQIRRMKRLAPFLPLAGWGPVKRLAQRWVEKRVTGPSEQVREMARVHLWGEVRNAAGRTVTATLETPEGYRFTAASAVASIERVLQGTVPPGAWTPSRAFGADFVNSIPGVVAGELRRA